MKAQGFEVSLGNKLEMATENSTQENELPGESLLLKSPESAFSSFKIELRPLEDIRKNIVAIPEVSEVQRTNHPELISHILQKKIRTDEEAWILYDQIKDFKFFSQVFHDKTEPEDIIKIVKSLRYRKIKAGKPVFVEDDPSNGNMYVVYSGELLVMVKKLDVIAEANLFNGKKLDEKKVTYVETVIQDLKQLKTMMTEVEDEINDVKEIQETQEIKDRVMKREGNAKKRRTRSQRISKIKLQSQGSLEKVDSPRESENNKLDVIVVKPIEQLQNQIKLIRNDSTKSNLGSKRMKSLSEREVEVEKEKNDSSVYGYVKDKILRGGYFGERALESNAKRGATILANTDCELLILTTQTYNTLKAQLNNKIKEMMDFLIQTIPGLKDINAREIMKSYMYLFEEKACYYGNHIVNEGEKGDVFYFLYEGCCEVYRTVKVEEDDKSLPATYSKIKSSFFSHPYAIKEKIPLTRLKEGSLIGEEILFSKSACYNYSVTVSSDSCKMICVNKDIFNFRFPKEIIQRICNAYDDKKAYKEGLLYQNLEKRHLNILGDNLDEHFLAVKRNVSHDISMKVAKINKTPSQFTSYKLMMDSSLQEDGKSKHGSPELPKLSKLGGSFLLDSKETLLKQKMLPYSRTNLIKPQKEKEKEITRQETLEKDRLPYLSKYKGHINNDGNTPEVSSFKVDHIRKTGSCSPCHDINEIYDNLSMKLKLDINPGSPQATVHDIDNMRFDLGREHGVPDKRKYKAVKNIFSHSENSSNAASPKCSPRGNKVSFLPTESTLSNKLHPVFKESSLDKFLSGKINTSFSSLFLRQNTEKSPFTKAILNRVIDMSPIADTLPTDASPISFVSKFEPTFLKDFDSKKKKKGKERDEEYIQKSLGEIPIQKRKHAYEKKKMTENSKSTLDKVEIKSPEKYKEEKNIESPNKVLDVGLSLQVKKEPLNSHRKKRVPIQKSIL